jgi:anhydro-N-acetylmuramic acid kinase
LLKALLADSYFRRPPPKSTGRDRFNLSWLQRYDAGRLDPEDVQATLAELTARSIGNAVERYCAGAEEVYLCGGGARNVDLVSRIRRATPGIIVASTELLGIHPDWVEAAAFAWLAQRALKQKPGSIPGVTGADAERVLGAIYPA